MSTDDSQWVTRWDAAALGRCSQDSIQRTAKKHNLKTHTSKAGATLLSLDDLDRVDLLRQQVKEKDRQIRGLQTTIESLAAPRTPASNG